MNRSCLAFFRNQVVFFVFLFWICKLNILRYTEDNIFALVCLTLKYLTELKVYFPDLKDQNEIVASDEHLCLCDRNVTCCFNSCTLFFYQTLGLSFCADHKCCPFLFLRQVFEKNLSYPRKVSTAPRLMSTAPFCLHVLDVTLLSTAAATYEPNSTGYL